MTQTFDLGKLRFNFAGTFSPTNIYELNDVVSYGGNVYCYTNALTSSGNLPTNTAFWTLMVQGFTFEGVFNTTTYYEVGDGVVWGGKVYIAIADSQNITPPNSAYWSQFIDGISYAGVYSPTVKYPKNDIVGYGGNIYISIQDTLGNDPTNVIYWSPFVSGINPTAVYNAATSYVPNDLVPYGANIFKCIANSKGNLPTNATYFTLFMSGVGNQGAYVNTIQYHMNDIVLYGNLQYRAIQDTLGNLPTDTNNWAVYLSGMSSKGAWATSTNYYANDIVNYGGQNYIALVQHTSTVMANDITASKWSLFTTGIRWRGTWAASTAYLPNDVVTDGINTWITSTAFTSGATMAIDIMQPNTGYKWAILASGASGVPTITSPVSGMFLTNNGTNAFWAAAVPTNTTVTANTAASGNNRYLCNTTAGGITITLSATPNANDVVYVVDVGGVCSQTGKNITVNGGAIPVMGSLNPFVLDVNNISATFLYTALNGWRLI